MDLERRSHRQVPGRKAMTTLLVKKEQTCHLEENPLYTVYPINRSKGLKKCIAKAEQKIINIQIRRQNWSQIGHTLRKPNCSVYKHALGWHLQEDGTHRNQGHSRNSCGKTRDNKMDRAGYPQGAHLAEKTAQHRERWKPVFLGAMLHQGAENRSSKLYHCCF